MTILSRFKDAPPDDNAFYMIQSSSSLLNDSADIQLSEDWLLLDPNKSVSVLINRFSSYSVNFTPIYSHIARVTTRTRQDLIARRMAQAKSNKRRSVLFSYVTLHQAPSFFCLNPSWLSILKKKEVIFQWTPYVGNQLKHLQVCVIYKTCWIRSSPINYAKAF